MAADPQIRSIRLWESSDPVPPPDLDHELDDPRIDAARRGLDAMYEAFPKMRSLYFQTPTGPTECQDLLGMEFRTEHFDGMARVPSYVEWALECDMSGAYAFHRRVLQLLQWHCPPRFWHLKTPVHTLALDDLLGVYPGAKFVWTHCDPAAVLGSVCSLIAYTRTWVSDRIHTDELGREQLSLRAEAVRRGMEFRSRIGEERFADVAFDSLQPDPVGAVETAYERLGIQLGEGRKQVEEWARAHPPGPAVSMSPPWTSSVSMHPPSRTGSPRISNTSRSPADRGRLPHHRIASNSVHDAGTLSHLRRPTRLDSEARVPRVARRFRDDRTKVRQRGNSTTFWQCP